MRNQNQFRDDEYSHWRNEQMSKLDEDYGARQSERRQKFAEEFNKWRTNRSPKSGAQPGSDTNTK